MRIALYGRLFGDNQTNDIQRLFSRLEKEQVQLLIYEPFYDFISTRIKIDSEVIVFTKHLEIVDNVDFVFSIGGDGTFLDATALVRSAGIPIVGINTGRLGFLAAIQVSEMYYLLNQFFNRDYSIESRVLLKLIQPDNLFGDVNFALNEITVHKRDSSSMVKIHTSLNGEFLNSYWADGLIISTPTGSTAYSLSCGGPIIIPGSNNFVLTPVAPHNLNVRPIVIPDNTEIKLKVESRSSHFLLSMDSRSETINTSSELLINKCNFNINMVNFKDQTYLKTIRNKLNWGLDVRN
jgi:NAD+ kinase